MGGAGHSIVRSSGSSGPLHRPIDLQGIPPTLIKREAAPRRTKIWEFSSHLHCSIIGTCLSTSNLRQVLKKFGLASPECTDHELHGIAVTLAARHDDAGRQLHKALDQRHKLAVNQFSRVDTEAGLHTMWRDAVRRGEIPGAYWATLTHQRSNHAIVREAFGEVHMLSHLVGSANRADIRRLCTLEADRASLEAKLERQQHALQAAVVSRDDQIKDLRQALADRIVGGTHQSMSEQGAAVLGLVGELERRLAAETRRRSAVEERLSAARAEAVRERSARIIAERDADAMGRELDMIEASLAPQSHEAHGKEIRLDGRTVLYVGGRPHHTAQMRASVEQLGATFLHHDGGVENHPTLLPGLASRADVVLFPVDCISHDAARMVKALCRQAAKPFIPLRSASITSLLAALNETAVSRLQTAG